MHALTHIGAVISLGAGAVSFTHIVKVIHNQHILNHLFFITIFHNLFLFTLI